MIHNAKYFTYNNRSLSEFSDMRIGTLDSDMYAVNIISNRNIIEQKIPGRKSPYLYNLDDDPLTIEMTVALERPKAISELRPFFRWLFNNMEYQELWFDVDPAKIYYAIFVGSPVMTYVDRSQSTDINANNRKLIGYITLTARCNAGTAFAPAVSVSKNTSSNLPYVNLYNNGDDTVFSTLRIGTPSGRFATSGEGASGLFKSTADNLRESYVSNGNTLTRINHMLITDTSKSWPYRGFSTRTVVEILDTSVTPNQVQLRAVDDNTNEGLYLFTRLTNIWANNTEAAAFSYTVRELQRTPETTGTVTGSSSLTLVDSQKNWTTDQWLGYAVKITSGLAKGQVRKVIANTSNTLTIGSNPGTGPSDQWEVLLQQGDRYEIFDFTSENIDSGTPIALDHTVTLFDRDKSFQDNVYAGGDYLLIVIEGTGSNEMDSEDPNKRKVRTVISNTENSIVVSPPFEFIPDDTTVYEIRPVTPGSQQIEVFKTPFKVSVKNTSNNTEVVFDGIEPLDTVEIDMATRRITSIQTPNIYEKWNRGYLSLETGANTIEVRIYQTNTEAEEWEDRYLEADGAVVVTTYIYQPIRYI